VCGHGGRYRYFDGFIQPVDEEFDLIEMNDGR